MLCCVCIVSSLTELMLNLFLASFSLAVFGQSGVKMYCMQLYKVSTQLVDIVERISARTSDISSGVGRDQNRAERRMNIMHQKPTCP